MKESVAKVLQHHAEHYEGLLNNLRDVGANEKEIGSIEKAIERARNQAEEASGALEKASAKVDAAAEKLKAADYTPEEYPEEPKEPDEIPEPDEPTEPDEIEYPDEPAEPDYQDIPDEPEPPSKDDFEDEADYDAAVKQHEQEHTTWKADVEKVREANAKADEDYAKAVADHKDKCKEVDSQNEANAKAYKDAMKEYPKAVEKVRSQNDKQSAAYTKAKEKWDKECEKVDARNEKADAKLNAAEQAHDEAKDAYDEAKDNFFDAVNNSESIDAQVDKVSDAIYNRVGDEWDEKEEAAAKESKEKGLDVVAINTKHATSKLAARENSWREKRFSAAYLLDPDKGFYGKDLLRNKLGKQLDSPSIDQSAMTVSSIITTEDVDRSGDIVVASGLDVAEHMRNPVVLLNHGLGYQLPIGKAQDSAGAYTVIPGDGFWRGTTYFSQSSKEAIQIFELIVEGILKGVSIGFIPDPDHVDYRTEKGISGGLGAIGGPLGLIIRKARLLEYSQVLS